MTPGEAVTGLSYLVGAAVFFWAARRRRMATEGMAILAGVGFVAGILGAKLTQALASGFSLASVANPGGRALLGGLAFGWAGVEIAKRRMGIRRSTGDLFALALPAGEAVGRIGCYLSGCCYGTPWDGPWAVWQHGAMRHPAQLYSAATAAATFGALLWLSEDGSPWSRGMGLTEEGESDRERKGEPWGRGFEREVPANVGKGASGPPPPPRFPLLVPRKGNPLLREGDLFRVYLLLFGVTRFGLEFFRWRESLVLGLSPMQWFCVDLVVIALVGLLRKRKDEVPQLRPGV